MRKRGYEQRKSAITGGVTDISFPICGRDGFVAAALTIPFLGQIGGSQAAELIAARALLKEAAAATSIALGHRPSETAPAAIARDGAVTASVRSAGPFPRQEARMGRHRLGSPLHQRVHPAERCAGLPRRHQVGVSTAASACNAG